MALVELCLRTYYDDGVSDTNNSIPKNVSISSRRREVCPHLYFLFDGATPPFRLLGLVLCQPGSHKRHLTQETVLCTQVADTASTYSIQYLAFVCIVHLASLCLAMFFDSRETTGF